MDRKLTIKDHKGESQLFVRRCIAALIGVGLLLASIGARLVYLQIFEHHFYSTLSHHNIINIIPLAPKRGLIYDRNGVLLATNVPVYGLAIIPQKVKHLSQTLRRLKKIIPISNADIKAFERDRHRQRAYQPVALVTKLTPTQVAQFYVNAYRFPGVIVQIHEMRHYPLGKITGNVTGYVGRITAQDLKQVMKANYSATNTIGKTGIEKYYEKTLHGKVGAEEVEIDASGKIVRVLKKIPPISGDNIYLTIDSRLQAFAEKALGDNSGAIVAIQPKTGQVLALVTKPSYNPNLFVSGISQADYEKLLHAPHHPLYDRAIRGLYSPGSTIKPFFAIGGLNDGIITPRYDIFDPGWFRVPGAQHVYHDWKYNGHGWVNVTKAIMVSCDTFFYNLALNWGIDGMDQDLKQFGFGEKTGINMPNELPGIVPSPTWKKATKGKPWYTGDTIITGIGQGSLLVTPLQLAAATSVIADHGMRLKPTLLLKTVAPNNTATVQQPIPEKPVLLKNPKTWQVVIHAMQKVVNNPHGTAEMFGRHPPYTVAAKTGTAQIFGNQRNEERDRMDIPKKLRNNHLFIEFAPVKDPQIALAIVVEHASFADRIARKITDFYFHTRAQHVHTQ